MKARAVVVAELDGYGRTRLTTLRSEPPLTLRPTSTALYVATSAAGPLGGDDIALHVTVGPGATLTVRTVAAAVALPGARGDTSTLRLHLTAEGHLDFLPEPTIVADNASHHTEISAQVTGGLILREEAILGRHGERGGRYRSSVYVDLAGLPLLRSDLTLDGTDPVSTGPSSAIAARATGSILYAGTAVPATPPPAATTTAAALPLAGHGLLVTATAADGRTLRQRLDLLTAR